MRVSYEVIRTGCPTAISLFPSRGILHLFFGQRSTYRTSLAKPRDGNICDNLRSSARAINLEQAKEIARTCDGAAAHGAWY